MIQLIIGLIIVGVLLWIIENYLPMDAAIKRIIQVVVLLAVIVWVARAFGVF